MGLGRQTNLPTVIAEAQSRASRLGHDHARLWDALAAAAEGGKRFRPLLVHAAHDALQGTCSKAAEAVGVAVELLHTAFVIHDDVIDGDDIRRGRLNVSGTFRELGRASGSTPEGAHSLAVTAGILAGDLALAAAIRTVATCGVSTELVTRLLEMFDDAIQVTVAGELADVRLSLSSGPVSFSESMLMAEHKTSAYSFSLPLQAGALLAGADDVTIEAFAAAGRGMGIAFQLIDDLLGVFGDPARTGKSATSDLRAHKQTPLLAHAHSTAQWPRIHPYLGRDLSETELAEVRQLLTSCGSRRFITGLIASHVEQARTAIEELGLPGDLLDVVTSCLPALSDDGVAA